MSDVYWSVTNVILPGKPTPRLDHFSATLTSRPTAILGPSGSGKTSLLNVLAGFEQPQSGEVKPQFIKATNRLPLFWVPHTWGLWPHLTVQAQLEKVVTPPTTLHIERMLQAFDLFPLKSKYPHQLSQGEQSRVAVARALVAAPQVLLMDEPLVHVDPARAPGYWEFVREWCQSQQIALLFSTHQPEVALREAEEVLCLKEGRLLFQGSTQDLYQSPPSEELARYLGPTNWFAAEEVSIWFENPNNTIQHHRPEQLTWQSDASGPCEVEQACSLGALQEVDLHHPEDDLRRKVWLRSTNQSFIAGQRGFLKALLLLLGICLFSGCGSAEGVVLPVESTRYWMLPKDGYALPAPRAMGMSKEQNVLVLDTGGRVLIYTLDGKELRHWYMPEHDVGKPEGIIQLQDGRIAVADTHYHRVVFFNEQGDVVSMLGERGDKPGQFIYPVSITEDQNENFYVCEYGGNDRIQKFDRDGNFLLSFGGFGTADNEFQRASGITWHDGRIYAADAINNRIQVFTEEGKHLATWGSTEHPLELNYPYDIAAGPEDVFYVVEYGSGRVTKLNKQGQLLARYGSIGTGLGQFNTPWGITVDQQNNVFVADTGNRRVIQLNQ
ncbi:Putative 2-aminoethylphosphonate import ATP-binding protein PhnT [Polystyrenella longa]|uniref:2-aminoethylphosphonate import ATP-binding protein PhnT n=1 Tax=Polystyrenella longa TaxID=2528007 RepID=A0A518CHV2_9PLAN|nr:ATP-binding cassette domain-containing protein [Polystyrenella longa]QDU78791.1 Putative 2-aminoethylphosphonate import ATP-binding protein PhnT [Polystyrenella longa]